MNRTTYQVAAALLILTIVPCSASEQNCAWLETKPKPLFAGTYDPIFQSTLGLESYSDQTCEGFVEDASNKPEIIGFYRGMSEFISHPGIFNISLYSNTSPRYAKIYYRLAFNAPGRELEEKDASPLTVTYRVDREILGPTTGQITVNSTIEDNFGRIQGNADWSSYHSSLLAYSEDNLIVPIQTQSSGDYSEFYTVVLRTPSLADDFPLAICDSPAGNCRTHVANRIQTDPSGADHKSTLSVRVPFPEDHGDYYLYLGDHTSPIAGYRFVHQFGATKDEATDNEANGDEAVSDGSTTSTESEQDDALEQKIAKAAENGRTILTQGIRRLRTFEDLHGRRYFVASEIFTFMDKLEGVVLEDLDTPQSTALRDFVGAEVSKARGSLAFRALSPTMLRELRNTTHLLRPSFSLNQNRQIRPRLVSAETRDYVTSDSANRAQRILFALLERLEAIAEQPTMKLCAQSTPSGAEIYIRPRSSTIGEQRTRTFSQLGKVYRGVYHYEVKLHGFKPITSNELNLVHLDGNTLDCHLSALDSDTGPYPCRVIESPCLRH